MTQQLQADTDQARDKAGWSREGLLGDRSWPSLHVKAWMLSLPVDLAALSAPALWNVHQLRATGTMAVLAVVLLAGSGRYRARLHVSLLDELPSLVGRAALAAGIVACVTALRHQSQDAAEFLRFSVLGIVLLVIGRAVTNYVILTGRRRRIVAHPVVLVGGGELGAELSKLLARHAQYGLAVIGYVDDRPHRHDLIGPALLPSGRPDPVETRPLPWLGPTGDLNDVVADSHADVILVADPLLADPNLLGPLRGPAAALCDLLVVPRMHEFHTQAGLVDHIGAIPIMRIRNPLLRGPFWFLKRIFDIVVSGMVLVLLAPVLVGCALLIRIMDGPGVIFKQQRITRDGRLFEVWKFRSMRAADETEAQTTWSIASDKRVSQVGRFLRRTSLDELPQLYNILRGDMTLVGPRPERPYFAAKFAAEHPRYNERLRVPCGLTGLAQVSGLRGDTDIGDRARHDNFYIENWSLWLDAKVLIRTVREVIGARGR